MNTQLDSIKSEARMLLYTDIHLTEFSPVVVQHPFTTSGFVGIKEDGSVRILDVAENEDALHIWREYVCGLIEKSETAYDLYMLFTAPYALAFLKYAKPYLSKQDLSKILASAWTQSENPNRDPNVKRWDDQPDHTIFQKRKQNHLIPKRRSLKKLRLFWCKQRI